MEKEEKRQRKRWERGREEEEGEQKSIKNIVSDGCIRIYGNVSHIRSMFMRQIWTAVHATWHKIMEP